jgi:hypothetical protein
MQVKSHSMGLIIKSYLYPAHRKEVSPPQLLCERLGVNEICGPGRAVIQLKFIC